MAATTAFDRKAFVRRGRYPEYFTVCWNAIEGLVAVVAGAFAGRRFRLVLKSHFSATPRNRYLFETRRFGPFTTRRIQQIVQGYREKAGMSQPIHPHLFRHQMLDLLDIQGPLRRTDPTNFRPRKQKKPGGLPASVVGIGR
jgi:integrase